MKKRESLASKRVWVIDVFDDDPKYTVNVFLGEVKKIDDKGVLIRFINSSEYCINYVGEFKPGRKKVILYSFFDFQRLYFNSAEKAIMAAAKIPDINDTVYVISDSKTIRKELCAIKGLSTINTSNYYDLYLFFKNDEKAYTINEIGKSIFFCRINIR